MAPLLLVCSFLHQCVSLCVSVSLSLCLCVSVCLSIFVCVWLCVSLCLCVCLFLSVCLCVCYFLCLCLSLDMAWFRAKVLVHYTSVHSVLIGLTCSMYTCTWFTRSTWVYMSIHAWLYIGVLWVYTYVLKLISTPVLTYATPIATPISTYVQLCMYTRVYLAMCTYVHMMHMSGHKCTWVYISVHT